MLDNTKEESNFKFLDFMVKSGLAKSKNEAKRLIIDYAVDIFRNDSWYKLMPYGFAIPMEIYKKYFKKSK